MSKDSLYQYIQSLVPLSISQVEKITKHFEPFEFKKGDILLKQGSISMVSQFVESGVLRSFSNNYENEEVTLDFFQPNCFATNFNSLFNQNKSMETIQALTDVKTWGITFQNLQNEFHLNPEFRELGRAVLVSNYSQLKKRLYQNACMSAEQRYLSFIKVQNEVTHCASLKQIASFIGITDTSLSRIRKGLSQK